MTPPPQHQTQISVPEIRESIERSGYLLEGRVKRLLERDGYFVQTNAAYPDPETGVSREIDISAISGLSLSRRSLDFIYPVILCECENNHQPVVFFESASPVAFMYHEQVKYSGIPMKFWQGKAFVSLSEFFGLERFHHYCRGSVATQYCTFSRKSGGAPWIASHTDVQHQTFNALINSVEAAIEDHYSAWVLPKRGRRELVDIMFYYPLLVLRGELYLAKETRHGLSMKRVKHLQYRREVWSSKTRDTYQIDVIQETYLRSYLNQINSEMEAIKRRFRRKARTVRASIDRLVDIARYQKKPGGMKRVFHVTA